MIQWDIETVAQCGNHLGENPLWCDRTAALYWIDCDPEPALFRLHVESGEQRRWPMPARIGALALTESGALLVALRDRLALFDPESGRLEMIAPSPIADIGDLHEGRCDRQGRFWIGSISRSGPGQAAFFCLTGDRLEPIYDGITIGNGLAFSPDGRILYHADTAQGTVWAADYDIETGAAGPRRPFVTLAPDKGGLDGAAVDADGTYWVAIFRGGAIHRYSPQGLLLDRIELPVTQPTMAAFGGPDLTDLYITSTRWERGEEPGLGNLLRIRGAGRGVPEPRFAG